MSPILVGTTSWTEKTLVESGRSYPPDVHSAEARLRYYATRFPVVEVDSAYYGLPSEQNASLWVERTPDGFVFDVKAFRLFPPIPRVEGRLQIVEDLLADFVGEGCGKHGVALAAI